MVMWGMGVILEDFKGFKEKGKERGFGETDEMNV